MLLLRFGSRTLLSSFTAPAVLEAMNTACKRSLVILLNAVLKDSLDVVHDKKDRV